MRPCDGRFSLWPLGVGIFVLVLVSLSVDTRTVLSTNPPADFLSLSTMEGSRPELATKYWEIAERLIQWKYTFGSALPERPPDDFQTIGAGEKRSDSHEPVRIAYWNKLREEWGRPDNWHRAFGFDFQWPERSARTLSHDIENFFKRSY